METVPLVPTNPAALATRRRCPRSSTRSPAQSAGDQRVSTPRAQRVDEALIKGVQSLLLKEKTVEQVLDDADKAQKG